VQNAGEFVVDPSSRSFHLNDLVEIVNELKKEYGVIIMSEFPVALEEADSAKYPVATPNIPDIRVWASVIQIADHFVGCDSVGQHMARAFDKTATVVTGSTFPVNITYPECKDFDVIDLGEGKRVYSPIRISLEDHIERHNDEVMEMSKAQKQTVLQAIRRRLGKSTKFKGTYTPIQQDANACCTPAPSTPTQPMFSTVGGTLKPVEIPGSKQ
jgi:ADP-heptose:LPS heptosyltransferase